jgi:hypothetical protein
LRKQRQHGDDRTALDDDVKEVAFLDVQKFFGDEQMAGRRNGYEFGDPFYYSENNNDNPVRHGDWLDAKPVVGKK